MGFKRTFEDNVRYRLIRPVAQGGMGLVYLAEQLGPDGFQKKVAIKFIRQEYSSVEEFRHNFVGEARLVADLIHGNIVQTYHLGCYQDQYYMVMEWVDGFNLEEVFLQHKALGQPIPVDLACFITSRVCRALAYAHTRKDANGHELSIVHRDVCPRNIMLARDGEVKLTDFGIAKAFKLMYNREGDVIAGKDEYLSPEQASKQVTDGRADLFSCGVVLCEMICDQNIFLGKDGAETRSNILNMPLPNIEDYRADCLPAVVEILSRSLNRDRSLRYQKADEMMLALELFLYSDGYGPTNEKLADYLNHLYADGVAYDEDRYKNGLDSVVKGGY